jgi:hypothetical protein
MEALRSSETLADFQRTTRRYIPEDSTLHNHRCENLKSYILLRDSDYSRVLDWWSDLLDSSIQRVTTIYNSLSLSLSLSLTHTHTHTSAQACLH